MKITANLIVPSIEACLPFYIDRLGFTKQLDVPHEDKLGFVSLERDGAELMMQSHASLADDIAHVDPAGFRTAIYLEVAQLAPLRAALAGWPLVIPERTTFYGAREIITRDPAGNLVVVASREAA